MRSVEVLYALGQVAHFIGNHGKASTHFACAGRFDCGVKGEQVGLFGDAMNLTDHAADLLAVGSQLFRSSARFAARRWTARKWTAPRS